MGSMNTTRPKWLMGIALLAAVYLVVGFGFAGLAGRSATVQMRDFWRITAWAVSGAAFLVHLWYEHFRLHSPPRTTALHTSSAAAVASFGLAGAANIHAHFVSSTNPTMIMLAIVLWPLLTMAAAFAVAFIIAFGVTALGKKS
jgi:hypothetical protein